MGEESRVAVEVEPVEREPSHQDGRVCDVGRMETVDAVAIVAVDSESTLPVATDTGVRPMTTVGATLTMPPASQGSMDAIPAAVML